MDISLTSQNVKKKVGEDWKRLNTQYHNTYLELLMEQNSVFQKFNSTTNELEKQNLLNCYKNLETQVNSINQLLNFSKLVNNILQGKFHGDDCNEIYNNLIENLKLIEGDFFVLIYHGQLGSSNWGYCSDVLDTNFFCHEWVRGYCYVISKINRNETTLDEYQLESKVDLIYRDLSGDCHSKSKMIYESLASQGIRPYYVVVKQQPGGFEHICYNVTSWTVAYHKWHDLKNSSGLKVNSFHVGVGV